MKIHDLKYESDKIRLMCLKNPNKILEKNDLDHASYEDIWESEELIYVVETPNYIILSELWVDSCVDAFEEKYGTFSLDKLQLKLTPRFKKIGKVLNLKFLSFNFDIEETSEILSWVVFKK